MRRSSLAVTFKQGIATIVFVVAAFAAVRAHALVLCTTPDGKTYAGDKPPPGCVVKGEYVNPTPAPETPTPVGQPAPTATPDPMASWHEQHAAERDRQQKTAVELERRKTVAAVVVEKWYWVAGNFGRSSVEGWVRNVADFEVYGTRVCLLDACVPTNPMTLQPAMSGVFHFDVAGGAVPAGTIVPYWKTEP